jgi:hypothetical protein
MEIERTYNMLGLYEVMVLIVGLFFALLIGYVCVWSNKQGPRK